MAKAKCPNCTGNMKTIFKLSGQRTASGKISLRCESCYKEIEILKVKNIVWDSIEVIDS